MRRGNMRSNSNPAIRILVLGDKGVGKSALVVRYLTKRYIGEYVSGTEITYQHDISLAGNQITAEICDATSSKNREIPCRKSAAKCDAYMLVYSVCNRDSFEYACSLVRDLRAERSTEHNAAPVLLVGNKCDLDHYREVKRSDGENIASTHQFCYFAETSAAESFQQVEEAFELAFRLISVRWHSMTTSPGIAPKRGSRKKSFSQVANLIRDHCKKQTQPALEKGITFEGFSPMFRSWSMSSDRNNNAGNPFQESGGRRRSRKSAVSALRTNAALHQHTYQRPKSKCMSLETLSEKPDAEGVCNEVCSTMPRCSSPMRRSNSLYQHSKYHTIDSAMATRFASDEMKSHGNRRRPPSEGNQMSVSTDENFDLSDFSTAEDDPFSSNLGSSHSSSVSLCGEEDLPLPPLASAPPDVSADPRRKTSLNKKCLKISIHSDGECNDGGIGGGGEVLSYPPKSAPLLASSNKFLFFPNAALSRPQQPENGWVHFGNAKAPVSPLLDGRRSFRVRMEEKRSPTGGLLKQFFKGARASTSPPQVPGSSPAQSPYASQNSLASTCTIADSVRSSTNFLASPDDPGLTFRASSTSLSSSVGSEHQDGTWAVTSSAPTSPRVQGAKKSRRFREAVSDLIRKRKKSHTSNEIYRTQQRV